MFYAERNSPHWMFLRSLNARQAAGGKDPRVWIRSGGRVLVHLMDQTPHDRDEPLCVLYRVYRPPSIVITPMDELPEAKLIPVDEEFDPDKEGTNSNITETKSKFPKLETKRTAIQPKTTTLLPSLRPSVRVCFRWFARGGTGEREGDRDGL